MNKLSTFLLFLFLLSSQFGNGQIQNVNMEAQSKWKQDYDGITKIKVHWENSSSRYYQEKSWVQEAINETWEHYANIDFYGWKDYDHSGKGIRILIDNNTRPNCKALGTRIDGLYAGMVLNFEFLGDFQCNGRTRKHCIKAIAVHEFGHALGIAHEQERPDCQCEEHPRQGYGSGGYFVTPCDRSSVMNYCNPKWNNDGKLSYYDIKGIQAVYGKKLKNQEYKKIVSTGNLSIADELGPDQIWENLSLNLGGTSMIFNINQTNQKEIKQVSITQSGFYNYDISSKTKRSNGQVYNGYGIGKIYLDHNKNYRVTLYMEKYEGNSLKIFLSVQDVAEEKQIYNTYPEDHNQDKVTITDRYKMFFKQDESPISLVRLELVKDEKFYVYPNGAIWVYNTQTKSYMKCSSKEPPIYQSWNGIEWAWSFRRPIGNGKTETYSVSKIGEVWAISTSGILTKYGYVTYSDL